MKILIAIVIYLVVVALIFAFNHASHRKSTNSHE